MSEIPTYPDEQSIEQRIAEAEAKGFAAGLERAKLLAKSQVPDVDNTGNGDEYRRGQKRGALGCVALIDREIRAAAPQATARLDADKTAQPLTEIRAVEKPWCCAGIAECEEDCPSRLRTPPRSEEQVRAEERMRRLHFELDFFLKDLDTCGEGSCATVATCEVRERIQRALRMAALGPAPVDDTAARLAAAEDRVRVLEGALQRIVAGAAEASTDLTVSANVSACFAVIEEVARAALAKKSEGT